MEQDRELPVTGTGKIQATDEAEPSHRHPMDAISLAFGAIFVILGVVFLTGFDVSTLDGPETWTAVLASVGALLLAIGARRQNG